MGTLILAASVASKSTSSTSDYTPLLVIIVLFALLYFVMIRPQRNRQRQAQQAQQQVGNGARVRTTAGIYGRVVDGDNENVIVEIAPNVQVKMMRRAILNVLPDDEPDGIRQTVPDVNYGESSTSSDDRGDLSI
jgi:preprotein translocase subunit YajC